MVKIRQLIKNNIFFKWVVNLTQYQSLTKKDGIAKSVEMLTKLYSRI
jgi:hypothetical protein